MRYSRKQAEAASCTHPPYADTLSFQDAVVGISGELIEDRRVRRSRQQYDQPDTAGVHTYLSPNGDCTVLVSNRRITIYDDAATAEAGGEVFQVRGRHLVRASSTDRWILVKHIDRDVAARWSITCSRMTPGGTIETETRLHRVNGPAVVYADGRMEWWIAGVRTQ